MGWDRFVYDFRERVADAAWLLRDRLEQKRLQGPAHRFRDDLDRLAKP